MAHLTLEPLMGYVGFDELYLLVKGLPNVKHYAKTSDDAAGVGYSTYASKNRHDSFHVKWHPAYGLNVVDRFHVKNESSARSIYYEISRQKDLLYFKPGPQGAPVSHTFYSYDKDLLQDCDEIADNFMNKIVAAGYKMYGHPYDAEDAYRERLKTTQNAEDTSKMKNNLAVAYAQMWKKLSQKDQAANPYIDPQAIRRLALHEVQEIHDKIAALLPPAASPQTPPKMVVSLPLPKGTVAQPGTTAFIAQAPAQQG